MIDGRRYLSVADLEAQGISRRTQERLRRQGLRHFRMSDGRRAKIYYLRSDVSRLVRDRLRLVDVAQRILDETPGGTDTRS